MIEFLCLSRDKTNPRSNHSNIRFLNGPSIRIHSIVINLKDTLCFKEKSLQKSSRTGWKKIRWRAHQVLKPLPFHPRMRILHVVYVFSLLFMMLSFPHTDRKNEHGDKLNKSSDRIISSDANTADRYT